MTTETNPAAEADRIVQQALADAAKAGTTIEADVEAIKTDITGDVEKALDDGPLVKTVVEAKIAPAIADAGTAEITIHTDVNTVNAAIAADVAAAKADTTTAVDAIKDAQAGVQAGFAAAKSDTDVAVEKAHGAASEALSHIEKIPAFISAEVKEARQKLSAAIAWFEAHLTASAAKATAAAKAPTPPAA